MKPEQTVQPRQGRRAIDAERRRAMAQEKARITGQRVKRPSALEEAAARWEKEREAGAGKLEEERLRTSRQADTCPLSFQPASLQAPGIEAPDEVGWQAYSPPRDKRTATTVTGRVNAAGVGALSRHLMAIERARALGRKPVDRRAYALEQEARRWAEGRGRRRDSRW